MATSPLTPRLLSAGRWVVTSALDVARRLEQPRVERIVARPQPHPLQPAAIRVERSHGENASQTAVTMWFGEGPALPAPGMGRAAARGALQVGAGLLGAAALAALTTVAAQREQTRFAGTRVRRIAGTVDGVASRSGE